MILEYTPTNLKDDVSNIKFICKILPITKIIISASPMGVPHPNSIISAICLKQHLQDNKISIIPTIKTSNYCYDGLKSDILSLEYANILEIAIISGDSNHNKSNLSTIDALQIIKEFNCKLNIFCALGSEISQKNIESLIVKINFGVQNFITQPFFIAHNEIQSYEYFIKNIREVLESKSINYENINFYCGFLPLFSAYSANMLNNKNVGIKIPSNYIKDIELDSINSNIALFKSLINFNVSIGYLNFENFKLFLQNIKNI